MNKDTLLAVGCDMTTRRIYVGECTASATHLTCGTDITGQALAAVLLHIGVGYEVEVCGRDGQVIGVLSAHQADHLPH